MRIVTAFLVGCLIAAPAYAQETPAPAPTSEEILLQGLTSVSVCVRSNMFAVAKLGAIVKTMQAEGADKLGDDGTKNLNSAADALNDLNDITLIEKRIGRSLIVRLTQEYNHTLEDLNESLKPFMLATDEKMKELFKDVDEFPEFDKRFLPKLDLCTTMITDLAEKVKEIPQKTPEVK